MSLLISESINSSDGTIQLSLKGDIDQSSVNWPALKPGNSYFLDLNGISGMSSAGAQSWILWTRTISADVKVAMVRLPTSISRVANAIPQLIPAHWEIESFWVPFFCAAENAAEKVLFQKDVHFDKHAVTVPAFLRSQTTGHPLELDVHPETFFRFLKHRNPSFNVIGDSQKS